MLIVDTLLEINLVQEIGQEGRNSNVYKAYDKQLDANLVVKKIPKSDFKHVNDYFSEAQMLYATTHPNIMAVKYASQDKDSVYIAMDYYKNGSLNTILNKRFLSVREIIKYSLEFLTGLHFMHAKGLVHFDIKPTNILINDAGKATLTDFGLSKYINEQGFSHPDKFYTFHVPPETFEFNKSSMFSDIYQAGMTIYRMCNGNEALRNQFQQLNIKTKTDLVDAIKKNKFPKKDAFLPHIPIKLQQVIKKAIAIDPKNRYESVLEMINDISLIDENLDWIYNEDTNGHSVWANNTGDFTYRINLIKKSDDTWATEGVKIKNADSSSRRVIKWNKNGYTNKKQLLDEIRKMF